MAAVVDTVASAPVAPGRLRGFLSGARELDDAPVELTGALPAWLRGTLLLNGPALWELPGGRLDHWFDGYSMWHAVRLGDGAPRYRSRFALSESYRKSVARGRPAYGEFGSAQPAGLLARLLAAQVTDNPSVVMSRHGERWVSVTETPYLTYFDPATLDTIERLDLGRQGEPIHLMSAHGATLADGSYLNLATVFGPTCEMKLFRLRPGAVRPEPVGRVKVPKVGYAHGFGLAPGHAILWESALRVKPLGLRFNAKPYAENFRWEPEGGSMLHALPLDGGAPRSWRIPPMMAFHCTQAWADGDDLAIEMAIYDDRTVFDDLSLARRRAGAPMRSPARHVRYRLRRGRADAEPEPIPGDSIEMQQVHPSRVGRARASVCWGAGGGPDNAFFDRTIRVDLDRESATTWQRPRATHLEPLFVPRPGGDADDDGMLLVPTLADDDDTTVIGVVDARTLDCVAELRTPQIVPFGFHAAFARAD